MSEPVTLSVPMPLYGQDAELNTMAMLDFVMQHNAEALTHKETRRIANWFASKYQEVIGEPT